MENGCASPRNILDIQPLELMHSGRFRTILGFHVEGLNTEVGVKGSGVGGLKSKVGCSVLRASLHLLDSHQSSYG